MRKVFLLSAFFTATPILLLVTLVFVLFLAYQKGEASSQNSAIAHSVSYAALPTTLNIFDEDIIAKDSRVEKIRTFLDQYNSPLEPQAAYIVEMADRYGLDYRLLPSIAMQESNLCKKIPKESNNCWGFGIYGGKITRFENYEQAIETITRTLAKKYKEQGLETPDEIMSKYTPGSNGSWANSVNHFMSRL